MHDTLVQVNSNILTYCRPVQLLLIVIYCEISSLISNIVVTDTSRDH